MTSIVSFLPLMAVALAALAAFWIAGVLFTRRTAVFRRIAPNPFIEALFEQVVRLLFIVLGIVVAMSILGATALIGTVLGAAGVSVSRSVSRCATRSRTTLPASC